jgi:hypothetical protein
MTGAIRQEKESGLSGTASIEVSGLLRRFREFKY